MSQDPAPLRRRVEILNALGLRPAPGRMQVHPPRRSSSNRRSPVTCNGQETDGKSILALSTLAAERGSILEIVAIGPDAEAAVAALADLVAARFDENDNGDSVERAS